MHDRAAVFILYDIGNLGLDEFYLAIGFDFLMAIIKADATVTEWALRNNRILSVYICVYISEIYFCIRQFCYTPTTRIRVLKLSHLLCQG